MDGDETRSEALHRVAEDGRDWDRTNSRPAQTRKRRLALRALLFMCLVAVIAGGGYFIVRGGSRRQPSKVTLSALTFDHGASLGCASAPAWSPDGRLIAVLGTQQPCGVIARTPDDTQSLYFFDGATGKLERILKLEPLLQPQFSSVQYYGGCRTFNLSLCYDHIAWTPSGQSLALLLITPQPDPTKAAYALFIVEAHGKDARVIKGGAYTLPMRTPPATIALWDLHAQSVRYTQEPDTFNTASQLTWGQDGNLTPSADPSPGAVTLPVGNPVGGSASFSPWQPGSILLEGGPLLASDYWAWSPDGRYLATGLSTQIILGSAAVVTPTPGANVGYGVAAPRDEAITAVLAQARAQPVQGEAGFGVAWTPSGGDLAELRCASAPTPATLSIWTTHTGARVMSTPIALSQENADCGNLSLDMAWSPDGLRLALVSPTTGGIAVVQPRLA